MKTKQVASNCSGCVYGERNSGQIYKQAGLVSSSLAYSVNTDVYGSLLVKSIGGSK